MNTSEHWNKIYKSQLVETLGWYEEDPATSLQLIYRCNMAKSRPIIDVGSGASRLIPRLVAEDYRNLIALDHAGEALRILEDAIPADRRQFVRFISADVCSDVWPGKVGEVTLWHDRALLHFLTEKSACDTYMSRLRQLVVKDGYAIIGAFSLQGASQCSGLPVQRYSEESLSQLFNPDFQLIESWHDLYRMPSGDPRPYIYALFKRIELL